MSCPATSAAQPGSVCSDVSRPYTQFLHPTPIHASALQTAKLQEARLSQIIVSQILTCMLDSHSEPMGSPTLVWRPHTRRTRHVRHCLRIGAYGHIHTQAAQVCGSVSHPPLLSTPRSR
jgi:hypothetical protein